MAFFIGVKIYCKLKDKEIDDFMCYQSKELEDCKYKKDGTCPSITNKNLEKSVSN